MNGTLHDGGRFIAVVPLWTTYPDSVRAVSGGDHRLQQAGDITHAYPPDETATHQQLLLRDSKAR